MIYRYCLMYDGEIIPFPSIDEREAIEASGGKPAKRSFVPGAHGSIMELRSCGAVTYAADWPSIALLGVSKRIREGAANYFFGKNVWRLSCVEGWETTYNRAALWCKNAGHFRHITTHMSMNDAEDRVQGIKETRAMAKKQGWSANELESEIHKIGLGDIELDHEWRSSDLMDMNLKTLVFNVENLFCPRGCCRQRVLKSFCQSMSKAGPWYRLGVGEKEVKERRKTNVKVVGLEDDSEKEIFMKYWGLEV